MKIKILIVVSLLLGLKTIFAGMKVPADYTLYCSDLPFADNRLNVQSDGNQVSFTSTGGHYLGISRLLKRLPNDDRWERLQVTFSFPVESCQLSKRDNKMITCFAEPLMINIKSASSGPEIIDEKVELGGGAVRVRKVEQLSFSHKDNSSGYELIIKEYGPVLLQQYLHVGGDETGNCKVGL